MLFPVVAFLALIVDNSIHSIDFIIGKLVNIAFEESELSSFGELFSAVFFVSLGLGLLFASQVWQNFAKRGLKSDSEKILFCLSTIIFAGVVIGSKTSWDTLDGFLVNFFAFAAWIKGTSFLMFPKTLDSLMDKLEPIWTPTLIKVSGIFYVGLGIKLFL